jgi:hypothetical protein
MTLDASGNLLVGGTSNALGARAIFENAAGNQIGVRYTGIATYYLNADSGGSLVFSKDGTERARISSDGTFRVKGAGTAGSTDAFLVDGAAPASAARITSGGDLLVGTTSPATNRRLVVSGGGISAEAPTSVASGTFSFADNGASPNTARFYNGTDSNDATQRFIICDAGASVPRAEIRSNGGLANSSGNNVNLSDERVKTDIKPLGSMWDKFKAIEIVAFKYKDQTHDDNNIGVVAQQVESVAPEFVDVDGFGETPEDGVPLKTIYTEDFHNAAIKALQEAMARIEQLEAKVAALESK